MFDLLSAGVAGMDSQTALAVQSLLESQTVAEQPAQGENTFVTHVTLLETVFKVQHSLVCLFNFLSVLVPYIINYIWMPKIITFSALQKILKELILLSEKHDHYKY